jgi:hypothetical protein
MKKINVAIILAAALALAGCNEPTNPGPSSGHVAIMVSCEDGDLVTRDADTLEELGRRPLEVGEACP